MELTKSNKVPIVISLIFLFAFSSFAVIRKTGAASQPATPSLGSITFVDYAGNDASGVADLQANKIDTYDFALTPSASASVPSSYYQYVAPASIYGLYVNPQNTSAGVTKNFNPFYFQKARFALNYLIDRSYFGQTIEGGKFIECVSAVCAEPDSVVVAGAVAPFSNITYSFQLANKTISSVLSANGATYANHQWLYKGKPITLGLFDRIDDPIRHVFMQYLNSQLQKIGFQTNLITGTLSDAYHVVFGSDPVNATWDIYPASNAQIWGYYDSNAINFYSAGYYEDLPASDHYGQNWVGNWDNKTQEPASTALYDKADTYAIPLLNSKFSTIAQRNGLLANLTYYGVLGATYICLGTSLAPYASTGTVSGVTPNFVSDPFGNYQNYLTLSVTASGAAGTANSLKMGVRHITNGAVNPGGGDDDAYSINMEAADALPLYTYGPSTGYPYSTGMTYKINGNSFRGDISVPSSAIWFNGTGDKWQSVAADAKAQDDVTVDFSKIFSHTTWSDGQPVTLADLLMQYVVEARIVQPGPLQDKGGEHGLYSTDYGQVVGIRVLNSTALEIYTTGTFFPDANWAALGAILDVASPLGYAGYTNGMGMTPWQLYYAMEQVVINNQAAWSTATATKKGIDWLNLLNPTDIGNVKAALTAAGSTIAPELVQLQSMTGQTWVTTSTASAGYSATINFINTNGVGVISDGPFYISKYSSSTSPAFLVMKPNPGFMAASVGDPRIFAQAVVLTSHAAIPPVLAAGGSFTITVLQTPDGAPSSQSSPASNATAVVRLVANGATMYSKTYTTDSFGQATLQVPATLPAGTYLLSVYADSATSKLIKPIVQSITITAASTSTTTATTTATATSTSTVISSGSVTTTTATTTATATSTSTVISSGSVTTTTLTTTTPTPTDYTPYIVSAIVVVIVIAIAAVVMRRRGGAATPPTPKP